MGYTWAYMSPIRRAQVRKRAMLALFLLGAFLGTLPFWQHTFAQGSALTTGISATDSGTKGGAAALSILSFGGRIISQPIPCSNGGLWMLIVQPPPKQPSVIAMIWTPATLTFLWGPPRQVGQSILGIYDIPYVCTQGPHIPALYGFRMRMIGTSPTI